MPKTSVYNLQGETVDELELSADVFGIIPRLKVVQYAVRAQQANASKPYAHTKDRDEVRGGGRKPWKQKGTGNARQGSIRSPLWRGGGITFGPTKERNLAVKVNKKERRLALKMVLSDKVANNHLVVVDNLSALTGKTKQLAEVLSKLPVKKTSALVAATQANLTLQRAARNLPTVETSVATSLNVRDLLKYQFLVAEKSAIEKITSWLTK